MNFWWVNHGQTFNEELAGGYVWSPTKNKNGTRNETYLNLTKVEIRDVIFSYADGKISAVGVAEGEYSVSEKPAAFKKSGGHWASTGWLVPVRWTVLRSPIRPQDHLSAIVPLLPDKYAPIRK